MTRRLQENGARCWWGQGGRVEKPLFLNADIIIISSKMTAQRFSETLVTDTICRAAGKPQNVHLVMVGRAHSIDWRTSNFPTYQKQPHPPQGALSAPEMFSNARNFEIHGGVFINAPHAIQRVPVSAVTPRNCMHRSHIGLSGYWR